jgi:CBS domain containing-hemolysin-like protein
MMAIKKGNNSEEELAKLKEEDPYWNALLDDSPASKIDFLSTESFAMTSMVLILNNLSTSIFAMETIWPMTIAKYWSVILCFLIINVFFLVFFTYVVYKGTTFKKMFNVTNQIVVGLTLIVFVTATIWTCITNKLISPYKGGSGSRYYDLFKQSML